MSKLYIAGPMSGIEDHNKQAFLMAEAMAQTYGDFEEIFNPITSDLSLRVQDGKLQGEQAYRQCMALDLKFICEEATDMFMLKGWERSRGAVAEHATAVCLSLNIQYE